jgi:hypothetical protein
MVDQQGALRIIGMIHQSWKLMEIASDVD